LGGKRVTLLETSYGSLASSNLVFDNGSVALLGGNGDDDLTVWGTSANTKSNYLDGRAGNDTLVGHFGNDVLLGGEGDDDLDGWSGRNLLNGGPGNDRLWSNAGQWGVDTLLGGFGDDQIHSDLNGDVIDGGAGFDRLVVSGLFQASGIRIDISRPEATVAVEVGGVTSGSVRGIEQLQFEGSHHADFVRGGSGDDFLVGGYGNDTLEGGAGDDTLVGQEGDDTLIGGAGDDELIGGLGGGFFDGGDGDDLIHASTQGLPMGLVVDGGRGYDMARIVIGRAFFFPEAGIKFHLSATPGATDQILHYGQVIGTVRNIEKLEFYASAFNDSIAGANGNDRIFGLDGDDLLNGRFGNDTIEGGEGNDTIAGGAGDDLLVGGSGNDNMMGNDGNDTLEGGAGIDRYFGGPGADTFVLTSDLAEYAMRPSMDYVLDFNRAQGDKIDFRLDVPAVFVSQFSGEGIELILRADATPNHYTLLVNTGGGIEPEHRFKIIATGPFDQSDFLL
jgi:Ca2+-binding RTX toxin-like protein